MEVLTKVGLFALLVVVVLVAFMILLSILDRHKRPK